MTIYGHFFLQSAIMPLRSSVDSTDFHIILAILQKAAHQEKDRIGEKDEELENVTKQEYDLIYTR